MSPRETMPTKRFFSSVTGKLLVTFYIPCVATLAALVEEIGWKLTLAVAAYSWLAATVIGLAGRVVLVF